jgi:thiol-disulfide isomerase/thioredoxin
MKAQKIFLVLLLIISNSIFAEGIKFQNLTYAKALEKAKAENKLIFIDAYASWCGPCKMLEKNTFSNKEVAAFFNKNFICLRFDVEKGEGIEIAKKFNITAMPSLFFIDGNDRIVKKAVGYKEPEELLKAGEIALNPQNAPSEILKAKYNNGNQSISLVYEYLNVLIEEQEEYGLVLSNFLKKNEPHIFLENDTAFALFIFAHDSINKGKMNFFIENVNQFRERFGDEKINEFVIKIAQNEVDNKENTINWEEKKTQITQFCRKTLNDDVFNELEPILKNL